MRAIFARDFLLWNKDTEFDRILKWKYALCYISTLSKYLRQGEDPRNVPGTPSWVPSSVGMVTLGSEEDAVERRPLNLGPGAFPVPSEHHSWAHRQHQSVGFSQDSHLPALGPRDMLGLQQQLLVLWRGNQPRCTNFFPVVEPTMAKFIQTPLPGSPLCPTMLSPARPVLFSTAAEEACDSPLNLTQNLKPETDKTWESWNTQPVRIASIQSLLWTNLTLSHSSPSWLPAYFNFCH